MRRYNYEIILYEIIKAYDLHGLAEGYYYYYDIQCSRVRDWLRIILYSILWLQKLYDLLSDINAVSSLLTFFVYEFYPIHERASFSDEFPVLFTMCQLVSNVRRQNLRKKKKPFEEQDNSIFGVPSIPFNGNKHCSFSRTLSRRKVDATAVSFWYTEKSPTEVERNEMREVVKVCWCRLLPHLTSHATAHKLVKRIPLMCCKWVRKPTKCRNN